MTDIYALTEYECGYSNDHDWSPGDLECGRCGADLSDWNIEEDENEDTKS